VISLVYGDDARVAKWVGERARVQEFGPCTAIGIARDGRLVAGVVYNRYSGPNVEASIASDWPGWWTRGNLFALFWYPFGQLGCRRITAVTRAGNDRAQRMLAKMGFKAEGRCRHAFWDDDGIVYGMLAEECRWIGGADVQRQRHARRA